MDGLNGFYAGSIFATSRAFDESPLKPSIEEKFNFKRKCDRNSEVIVSTDTIVREGTAEIITFAGALQLVIKTR